MYRRVLPLLLTAGLLLSGCTAGQKNMPQKTDEKEMTGQPSDMSGEGSVAGLVTGKETKKKRTDLDASVRFLFILSEK